ncbi:MAG: hypothetical protein PHT53_07710 [Candidatus Omnitrophica bacterium]|nr:hypothetical protein [Candidatus Omnitrophota bacterium]
MKKAYLLAFSDSLGTREEVKNCVKNFPGITWRYDMSNAFYIISEENANQISTRIQNYFGKNGRFIVTEISDLNKQGWLTKDSWFLINNKKLPEK